MKKSWAAISLAMGTLVAVTACGSSEKCILPTVSIDKSDFSIECVTNMEQDFNFPIEGVSYKNSAFQEGTLEFTWVIYNTDRDIVGWFEGLGTGYSHNHGKWKYGIFPSYNNDVYCFSNTSFTLFLKGSRLEQFDQISFTSTVGTITRRTDDDACGKASYKYNTGRDAETGEYIPMQGAEKYTYCDYMMNFDGIDPNEVESIEITMKVAE